MEIPCKQKEAAVIVVPLDFTSLEADRQLEGNKGWTEGEEGIQAVCSAYLRPKNARGSNYIHVYVANISS